MNTPAPCASIVHQHYTPHQLPECYITNTWCTMLHQWVINCYSTHPKAFQESFHLSTFIAIFWTKSSWMPNHNTIWPMLATQTDDELWLCHCKTPSLLESYAHIHICQLTWMLLLPSMIMRSSLFQFVISTCLNKACFNHQHCIDMHHIGKLACCNADAIQINISIILAVQHWYASVPVRIGWWGDHAYGMVMVLADGETTPMVR